MFKKWIALSNQEVYPYPVDFDLYIHLSIYFCIHLYLYNIIYLLHCLYK